MSDWPDCPNWRKAAMLTALVLTGAALVAAAVALLSFAWRSRRPQRPRPARPARRENLSRTFNFDRYKRYEHR